MSGLKVERIFVYSLAWDRLILREDDPALADVLFCWKETGWGSLFFKSWLVGLLMARLLQPTHFWAPGTLPLAPPPSLAWHVGHTVTDIGHTVTVVIRAVGSNSTHSYPHPTPSTQQMWASLQTKHQIDFRGIAPYHSPPTFWEVDIL